MSIKKELLVKRFASKGSGLVSLSLAEALEVALCHGWIDSQAASVDAKRFRQRFTPRRARRFFEQLDGRNRYAILYRLQDAKKPETRQRRLAKFVRMLEAGETIH